MFDMLLNTPLHSTANVKTLLSFQSRPSKHEKFIPPSESYYDKDQTPRQRSLSLGLLLS